MPRACVIVLDAVGAGALPDADEFGDEGSDTLGNVARDDLVDVYREHPLLRRIRAAEFAGRCGACTYRELCGGSRARAYAASGDPLGEDPFQAIAGGGRGWSRPGHGPTSYRAMTAGHGDRSARAAPWLAATRVR